MEIRHTIGSKLEDGDEITHRKGGWVRFGDQIKGGARQEKQGGKAIFADFLEPARMAGAGVHLKNLYNDYVYFWRWALWRLFEQQNCGGILSFITASSYLAGPGFVGMREVMRRTFDELWIIDLGGDNIGARKNPNVFAIKTPVAIAIGVRAPYGSPDIPAKAWYGRITGDTRDTKLAQIAELTKLSDIEWDECPSGWGKPFLPARNGSYFDWIRLQDVFPWTHTGVQFQRTWPIGETERVLLSRWNSLIASKKDDRARLFKESRDRKITYKSRDADSGPPISKLDKTSDNPKIQKYLFRSFDIHHAIVDTHVGDFLRPPLLWSQGPHQVFLASLITEQLGRGQAMTVGAYPPDLNYFHGRHGMVMPLFRDPSGTEPNIAASLLDTLSSAYGSSVSPEDLAGYVYAILGGQSYTTRFWNELETPGPRIPFTLNRDCFHSAAILGRRLIWLHTYGERFELGNGKNSIPVGSAKCIAAVPVDSGKYPENFNYTPESKELDVGGGRFSPVPLEIWDFEVSGLKVVQSWLAYRMKNRAGKKSSELDHIRPERWTPRMTDEFLELLWVMEATLAMESDLATMLDQIVSGPCLKADDLPQPTPAERKPPAVLADGEEQFLLLRDEDPQDGQAA